THHDLKKTYRGGLSYAFSAQPKNYKPFSSIGFIKKSKYLKLIRDFNFYLFPKRYGIQTDIIRNYNERKMRNNTPGALDLPPFVNKKISWNRAYNLSWDFTKSLSLNFTATNNAIIREPDGVINRKSTDSTDIARYQAFKDSLIAGIQNFGLNMGYSQNTAVNYNLPTKLFPLTDWITASARYTAKYSWQRAAFAVENWGHTIQNGRDINFNATGNFRTLYNKVPYFKKVEQKFRRSSRRKVSSKGKGNKKDDNKKNKKYNKTPVDHIVHFLMGTKTINATYSRSNTIILPGFNFETDILGTNLSNNYAPGFGFIFGQQGNFEGKDFTRYAADKGWLVKDSTMNNKHLTNHNERLNLRMTFEPVRDLKITLTHQKSYTRNTSDFFKFYDDIGDWDSRGYVETGNFQETVNMLPTAFIPTVMSGDYTSQVYDKFLELRKDVSQQLATENPNTNANLTGDDGFYDGYSGTSSDVLIPAFVAAYTGKSINEVPSEAVKTNLLDFRSIPVPNWDVKYTGLSKIETLKKYFKTISISHAYKATYNVGGFTSNLLYQETDGHASARDNNNVIIPKYQISTVSLSETFAPLINIDMSWVNSMTSRFEIKKSRTLNLSISNTQLMEIQSFQLTIGGGYIFKSVPFPFEFKKGSKIMSDLNVRLDMSYKRDLTILRRIVEGTNQPSNGRTSITFRLTGDYRINQRLNLRLFYNFDSANPIVVTSFPTSNTNFGITLRFSLAG
ncbi:MAG: cell surface protein SprA, partial [Bacteroidetes bacterium]